MLYFISITVIEIKKKKIGNKEKKIQEKKLKS